MFLSIKNYLVYEVSPQYLIFKNWNVFCLVGKTRYIEMLLSIYDNQFTSYFWNQYHQKLKANKLNDVGFCFISSLHWLVLSFPYAFLYNGVYSHWSNWCLPPTPSYFDSFERSNIYNRQCFVSHTHILETVFFSYFKATDWVEGSTQNIFSPESSFAQRERVKL